MTTHCAAVRPSWTPLNIALMVLGFIIFWPLGLVMLAYILWGDRLQGELDGIRRQFSFPRHGRGTGNTAFDAYRGRELGRLEAERRRLDEERREFSEFLRNLRRAKDQEEFDRFMAERESGAGGTRSA
jgi:hypothetical protein